VAFINPETKQPQEVVSGQYLLGIPLAKVIEDTTADIIKFRKRREDTIGRVTQQRSIVRNAPVVAGTRIAVGSIVGLHEDGYSTEAIIAEYPDLTPADVEAALRYGGKAAA
jgi:uncharacterized protein (DUF433 family)